MEVFFIPNPLYLNNDNSEGPNSKRWAFSPGPPNALFFIMQLLGCRMSCSRWVWKQSPLCSLLKPHQTTHSKHLDRRTCKFDPNLVYTSSHYEKKWIERKEVWEFHPTFKLRLQYKTHREALHRRSFVSGGKGGCLCGRLQWIETFKVEVWILSILKWSRDR